LAQVSLTKSELPHLRGGKPAQPKKACIAAGFLVGRRVKWRAIRAISVFTKQQTHQWKGVSKVAMSRDNRPMSVTFRLDGATAGDGRIFRWVVGKVQD
jgi:hypothetical protein